MEGGGFEDRLSKIKRMAVAKYVPNKNARSKTQQKRHSTRQRPQGVLNTIRVSVTVRKINVVLALDFFFTHERQSKFFTLQL